MTLDQELRLSYYQHVADINTEHHVCLVQNVRTGKFYVKKQLTVYNADIYQYLLRHPIANTPQIILIEECNGVLTIIEEYIPGDTLEELLEKQGTLPEPQVIDITTQLCSIICAFHGCTPAIVNRDIKPSNIKITSDGIVKLLDLNTAKWNNCNSDKDTVLLGTQGYAAPEQYGFGPSSVLTDIYSIGVLMNVMLTGHLPNKSMAAGHIGSLIQKCVELSPSGRYQSTAELLSALQEYKEETANCLPPKGWKRYLPPGFRGNNLVVYLFSAVGYALLFSIGFCLEVENAGFTELLINRALFTTMLLCIVFFNGNYLNVHSHFILTKSSKRWIRWLGMAIIDCVLICFWAITTNLLVSVLVR